MPTAGMIRVDDGAQIKLWLGELEQKKKICEFKNLIKAFYNL